ncbi:MAG: sulfurtransferase TusA family protein [Dissulfurispiraceae bacterium]|jgi:TusA-related sulfurtransferase|nr:sulfurtransferase TusA family protein [Dissulfurispiraceae bacterium]
MDEFSIDKIVDTRGSHCPGPIMSLIEAVKLANIGTVIEFYFEENQSMQDASFWVKRVGHQILVEEAIGDYFHFVVRKIK